MRAPGRAAVFKGFCGVNASKNIGAISYDCCDLQACQSAAGAGTLTMSASSPLSGRTVLAIALGACAVVILANTDDDSVR